MTDYICSGHALLSVDTFEKDRAILEINEIAKNLSKKVFIWSVSDGWKDAKGRPQGNFKATTPIHKYIECILEMPENSIFILKDFGYYINKDTYQLHDVVISWLDQVRRLISSVEQTIIFVGPDFSAPKPLLHDITVIDFDLPEREEILERINFVCSFVLDENGSEVKIDKKFIPHVIDACRGMTSQQIVNRVALALRKHKNLNEEASKTIMNEKAGIIRASGLLEYKEPPIGGLKNVGGYDALKKHVLLDKPCFTEEAREFGIEFPRGILLVGIPGCGKTLLSEAIASELQLPLVSMDVGNMMDKFVGESERNMRECIKMIESISPCVLQLDEVEKGFGGSGDSDGGSSKRVFGKFLTWSSDRVAPVYCVATANQVECLPAEFKRTGRFDAIFGLDLPRPTEREEIFTIQLKKRGRNENNYDIQSLSEQTEGFTGSDIEQVVKLGLKSAFAEGNPLSNDHLTNAITEIIPLSKTEGDKIAQIKNWCDKHAKPANPIKKSAPPKIGARKISL